MNRWVDYYECGCSAENKGWKILHFYNPTYCVRHNKIGWKIVDQMFFIPRKRTDDANYTKGGRE